MMRLDAAPARAGRIALCREDLIQRENPVRARSRTRTGLGSRDTPAHDEGKGTGDRNTPYNLSSGLPLGVCGSVDHLDARAIGTLMPGDLHRLRKTSCVCGRPL